MIEPPQSEVPPMLKNTTQGYSFGSVSFPPNILFGLFGIPQLQGPTGAGVVVSETVGLVWLKEGEEVYELVVVSEESPQQDIFSGLEEQEYKLSVINEFTYFINNHIHHTCVVGILLLNDI